jgi:hypothetical protein
MKEASMRRKRFTVEKIMEMLREAKVCRSLRFLFRFEVLIAAAR